MPVSCVGGTQELIHSSSFGHQPECKALSPYFRKTTIGHLHTEPHL